MTKKHYSNFLAYELLIDGKYHYYGSHCMPSREYFTEGLIMSYSGNPLNRKKLKHQITKAEYLSRVKLLNVWDFKTAEETWYKEADLVIEGREKYGELCLNQNIGSNKHFKMSPERIEKHKNSSLLHNIETSKPVVQIDRITGKAISTWESMGAASKALGIRREQISRVANGNKYSHSAGGFIWRFV